MLKVKILFITLVISCLINIGLGIYTYSLNQNNTQQFKYPLLDLSRNYIQQKFFLVNFVPLRTQLEAYLQKHSDYRISLYFEYLHTGSFIWLNQNERIPPASLSKLPVAMVMLKEIEEHKHNLSDKLSINESDKNNEWGNLYKVPNGTQRTIEELLTESLINSDNTAHAILYKTITKESAQHFGEAIGVQELFDTSGNTSVREMARIFRSLYTASYLNRDHSQWVLEQLSDATYRNLLRTQTNIRIASKFGISEKEGVFNEVGIIYQPDTPYVLSILMQSKDQELNPLTEAKAQTVIVEIRNQISKYITDQINKNDI